MKRVIDLSVGMIMILGLLCVGYLSVSFGQVNFLGQERYKVSATFSDVTGLAENTEVEMIGIPIGNVTSIEMKNFQAKVTMQIDKDVSIPEGSIASIRTRGLLGEKFMYISPGGLPRDIPKDGSGVIRETQSPVNLESLLQKAAFGSTGGTK
ncbi:MAG: MlaD family protein [bacterium]